MKAVHHLVVALAIGAAVLLGSVVTAGAAGEPASAPSGNVAHLKRYDTATESPGRYLFAQNGIRLKADTGFTLAFWAKASQPLRMRVSTKFDQAPWTGFGTPTVLELSTEWQRYEVPIDGTGSSPEHTRLQFHYVEIDTGDVWIADVQLREDGASPDSENLILNGRFESKLDNWHIEGVRKGVYEVDAIALGDANPAP